MLPLNTILLILILVLLLGGGGYYGHRSFGNRGLIGVIVAVLLIALVLQLVGLLLPPYGTVGAPTPQIMAPG
jgi:hypothetical protein